MRQESIFILAVGFYLSIVSNGARSASIPLPVPGPIVLPAPIPAPDPCGGRCLANSECVNGMCKCRSGFKFYRGKGCVDGALSARIPLPVPGPTVLPAPKPCGGRCVANSDCVNGMCKCRPGYKFRRGKGCVEIPAPVNPTAAAPSEAPPTEPAPTIAPPTETPPTEAAPSEAPPTEPVPTVAPPTEAPLTEAAPSEAPPTVPAPSEAPPTEAPPTEAAPSEAPPTETAPSESSPTEAAPSEAPPTEAPPTEAAPSEAPPTESAPSEAPPTEASPTEAAPSEAPPTESAPSEAPPTEAPPTESAPSEAPPTEAAPSEAPPTEAPPTEGAPSEAPPTESAPTEAPPTESPPSEPAPSQAPPTEAPPTEPVPTEKPPSGSAPTSAPSSSASAPTPPPASGTTTKAPSPSSVSPTSPSNKTPKYPGSVNGLISYGGGVAWVPHPSILKKLGKGHSGGFSSGDGSYGGVSHTGSSAYGNVYSKGGYNVGVQHGGGGIKAPIYSANKYGGSEGKSAYIDSGYGSYGSGSHLGTGSSAYDNFYAKGGFGYNVGVGHAGGGIKAPVFTLGGKYGGSESGPAYIQSGYGKGSNTDTGSSVYGDIYSKDGDYNVGVDHAGGGIKAPVFASGGKYGGSESSPAYIQSGYGKGSNTDTGSSVYGDIYSKGGDYNVGVDHAGGGIKAPVFASGDKYGGSESSSAYINSGYGKGSNTDTGSSVYGDIYSKGVGYNPGVNHLDSGIKAPDFGVGDKYGGSEGSSGYKDSGYGSYNPLAFINKHLASSKSIYVGGDQGGYNTGSKSNGESESYNPYAFLSKQSGTNIGAYNNYVPEGKGVAGSGYNQDSEGASSYNPAVFASKLAGSAYSGDESDNNSDGYDAVKFLVNNA